MINTLHATFAQRGNTPYAELFCTRAIAQCAYAELYARHACFSPDINVNLEHYGESVNAHAQFRHPRSRFSNTFTELLSPATGLAVGDCNVTKYGNTSLTLTKVPRSDSKHLKQLRMHKVRHSHRQLRRRGVVLWNVARSLKFSTAISTPHARATLHYYTYLASLSWCVFLPQCS